MLYTLIPPAIPEETLHSVCAMIYGVTGSWRRLEGERDQNYRVTGQGGSYVFKVCNPEEGDAIVACQVAALDHIAACDPGLPVPRVVRARDGRSIVPLDMEGRSCNLLLLSYLDGETIGERDLPGETLREAGAMLARLGKAMRGFIHAAPAARHLIWDTRLAGTLERHIGQLAREDQPLASEIMARHRTVTVPALAHLRSQIIHGDVHPYNVLMGASGKISGIIDFGDMVHAPLVQDVANAVSDFLLPGRNHAATIFEMIRGYRSITPFEVEEADAILDMMEVRLLMTGLIEGLKASHGIVSQGYFAAFNTRCIPLLHELRSIGREHLLSVIRRAACVAAPVSTPRDHPNILERRSAVMGRKPYVFYDPPLHMVQGDGVWLTAADGRHYMDCYNNVPHVGHSHPQVAEAIARQARVLNTNTRYLTDQSVDYAERLAELSPGLDSVVFVNSGSEANDLAFRMAKAWTGKTGALIMDFAYHGVTEAMDAFSPSNSPSTWAAPHIRQLPAPCAYRGSIGQQEPDAGAGYAASADPLIADLEDRQFGVAAVMIDSAFMTNGILVPPNGYLTGIADRVRRAGGLFIADEVQSGFGRLGMAFWGHRHHGVTPDIITIGKPAGNGYPIGAVVTRSEILERFLSIGPFFSTFGGNNVACAAGNAVLDVIRDEGLVENARDTGAHLRTLLRELMDRHSIIGDVRGIGLATGVELVRGRRSKEPATSEVARLLNLIRDQGVLVGSEGRFANVLKIRPPLVFSRANAVQAVAAIDEALARL